MRKMREQAIQESLDKLVDDLSPELRERVLQKWADDHDKFMRVAQENPPSKNPMELADRNCKHCYGRGIIGRDVTLNTQLLCKCTNKNYQKWLAEFRRYYNALREISKANGYDV